MAKWLIFALLCWLVCLPVFSSSIPLIYGTNTDFQSVGQGYRLNELFPLDPPTPAGTNTIQRDRLRFTNDATGYWYVTNVYPGRYRREFHGRYTVTTNFYIFPDTNGAVNADAPAYFAGPTNTQDIMPIALGDSRYLLKPTNNATASDGQVASKTGDKTKWITAGGSSTNNVSLWNSGQATTLTLNSTNNIVELDFVGSGVGSISGSLRLTPGGFDVGSASFSAGSFAGSGANLTALNASQLTSGTVADARLSSNVALKNGQNNFSQSNYFGKSVTVQIDTNAFVITTNGQGAPVLWIPAGINHTNGTLGAVYFGGPDIDHPEAFIKYDPQHDITQGEFGINVNGAFSITAGLNAGGTTYNHIGGSGGYHDGWGTQWDWVPTAAQPYGYSKVWCWPFLYTNAVAGGGNRFVYPNIQSVAVDTATGEGALEIYDGRNNVAAGGNPPHQGDETQAGWSNRGSNFWARIGRRNDFAGPHNFGWNTATISASTLALDFSSDQCFDRTLTASAVTLSTTSLRVGTTNYSRRVFKLRAGGTASIALTYPTGWDANGALPTPITAGNYLRLELEAEGGVGETNVTVVAAAIYTDNSFAWDSDALLFFTRASITDGTQKSAVNTLVTSLKNTTSTIDSQSLWSHFDAIYPMVGGNATAHSKNLIANTYNITWTATPTQDGNGVAFNGSTQYGDTTFNPTTASSPKYVQNSASILVWIKASGSLADNTTLMGAVSTPFSVIRRTSVSISSVRVNDTTDLAVATGSSWLNGAMVTRTASGARGGAVNASTVFTDTTASTGLPNASFYIGAENSGGLFRPAAFTCDLAGIASGFSSTDWTNLKTIIAAYQTALGR